MKKYIEEFKNGLDIATTELFLFLGKIVACICYAIIPLFIPLIIFVAIPLIIDNKTVLLICKILFSAIQIIPLSVSMAILSDDELVPENDPGKPFMPSKDLVIAVYIIINVLIWILF